MSTILESRRLTMSIPRWSRCKLGPQFHPYLVVAPLGRRIFLLIVIGQQGESAGRKQNLLHFGMLFQLGAHGSHDDAVMLAPIEGPVFHSLLIERYPIDTHGAHVLLA